MKSFSLALVLLMGLGLNLAGQARAQTIEPGLWELRHEVRMPDRPDMEAAMAQMREQMKNLPPEARKMMEQQMSGMGVGLGRDGAIRNCVSPEEAKGDVIREGEERDGCTYTKVSRSGNVWRGSVACKDPQSQGEFTVTLHDSKHYTMEARMTGQDQGRPTRMEMKVDARFISADCGKLAPRPARR